MGGLFGKKKSIVANKKFFNIAKEVKPAQEAYQSLLNTTQAAQNITAPNQQGVLTQLGQSAAGLAPSLATAQLEAAQNRTLAQQLAAIQGSRGSVNAASGQRQLAQAMSANKQTLAQQNNINQMADRNSFVNQAGIVDQSLRADIGNKFNADIAPKQNLQLWEIERVKADEANRASKNQMMGSLMGAAGAVAGGIFGGPAGAAAGGAVGQQGGEGMKDGGKVTSKYKKGGPVDGPGTPTSDSIPTMLSDGEFVVKAKVVSKPGILAALEKLNNEQALSKKELGALSKALAKGAKK